MQAYVVVTEQEAAEDGYVIEAVVTKPFGELSAEERAYDIGDRLAVSDKVNADSEIKVYQVLVDPTNRELEVTQDLHEIQAGDFVTAAYMEIRRKGFIQVPLWAAPAFLVHELRARYNLNLDFVGRQITIVSKEEMERRVASGQEPERRGAQQVWTEPDAGFVETQ